MENELLLKIQPILQMAPELLMGLVVIASVVARALGLPIIAKYANPVASFLIKVIGWLPTLGVNPKTKELEKAYESLKVEYEVLKKEAVKNQKP